MLKKFFSLRIFALMVAGMLPTAKIAAELKCSTGHPLDPLSCKEINAVRALIEQKDERKKDGFIYTDIVLKEPKKQAVLDFKVGDSFSRTAQVILYNNSTAKTVEYLVNVCGDKAEIKCRKVLHDVIPNMNLINNWAGNGESPQHITGAELVDLVLNSTETMKALQEAYPGQDIKELLKPTDGSSPILIPVSNTFEAFRSKKKFLKCCPEVITKGKDHHRYFPITFTDERVLDYYAADFFSIVHGVEAILDATDKKIVAVIKVNPKGVDPVNLDAAPRYVHLGTQNPITSNSTKNYVLSEDNRVVTWDNWKFRLGWQPHSGLELYQIQYWDQKEGETEGKYRSVLYKASLSDAMVSYNSGSEILFARNYLSGDAFHYPWMRRFAPICPGRDVPDTGSLTLLPMMLADTQGNPVEFTNSIAIYEQDSDILWRNASPVPFASTTPNCVDGARGRQLVVRTIFQGVYYLWIVSWVFNQDGSINVGVDVGGRTQNIIIPEGKAEEYIWGEETAPQEFSLNHTHMYNFRLDFDVDGTKNSAVEENQATINCRKKNPCGQAVEVTERVFKTEKEAIRDINVESNRQWIIINPNKKNRVGHETGYELLPLRNGFEKSADYSTLHKQFSFLKHHFHVTRFHDDEQFASGAMPILQDHDTGLGKFVKDDESIENEDIVAWYTLTFAHVPHTEDYPLISLYRQGFSLIPHNFFDSNPGVSIPATPGCELDQCLDDDGNPTVVYPKPVSCQG